MNAIEIHQKLQEAFGDAVGPLSEPKVDPFAVVKLDRIVDVCSWLKETPGIEMDFLEDLTAVDWPRRNVIEVVYHLQSFPHRHGIVLKVETDRQSPVVDSVEPDQ
jgi:NADH-quinone oxidoreductase subunit C